MMGNFRGTIHIIFYQYLAGKLFPGESRNCIKLSVESLKEITF